MKLTYDDFVGNKEAVEKVKLLTHEAVGNNFCRIPDIAFFGPSGHGKNTLAKILSEVLQRKLLEINSTVISDPFQFRTIITGGDYISTGVIIHLDECHALPRKIQDNLLSVLEKPRQLHTASKDQTFTDSLPANMSFIFSTTHAGAMKAALRGRLEDVEFLDYTKHELLEMAMKYLVREHKLEKSALEPVALAEIARRARSGRQVVKFCDNIVRFMKRKGETKLSASIISSCFEILGVDKYGLTRIDRKMLAALGEYNTFVGLDTLEAILNLSKKEIKSNIEPFLLQRGFLNRSSSGRIITKKGRRAVGISKE